MNAEEIKLVINPIMKTGDIKTAVNQIQGFFNEMNLSKGMKGDMESIFRELIDEAETFERKSKEAFKTAGDVKSFENSAKKINSLFEKISSTMEKLGGEDLSKLFTIDDSRIVSLTSEITKLEQKISQLSATEIKNVTTAIQEMRNVSKSGSVDKFFSAFNAGDMSAAESALKGLVQNVQAFGGSTADTKVAIDLMMSAFEAGKIDEVKVSFDMLEDSLASSKGKIVDYVSNLKILLNSFIALSGSGDISKAKQDIISLSQEIERINTENINTLGKNFSNALPAIEKVTEEVKRTDGALVNGAKSTQEFNKEISEIKNRATYFLGLENSVDLFKQGVKQAIEVVKELDAAMAETAVVTDFSIGDMWDRLPEYTQMANELGVATQGVYEASTLYYQQGLQTEEVTALTAETLKMARIAGLECADATNLMTAALRGFNMEISETSAQRVNDVYSELAAITAADTNEIATAMTKTASIANNANMELETTAALLAQMIETTREPAETAGTAMKTIIARFTEMKKAASDIVTVEGEEVSVNKVDAALASVGVQLKNTKGEFRDLDDVLLELASKWNSLDIMSQRYIATTAAGSRQQSRFIAMMQDYDRTMQLVDAAYNSAGSSSKQFEKTQESLESKLARLENAWNTFLMGIADDKIIKGFVDALTGLLNTFNKITEGADGVFGSVVRLGTVFAGLRLAKLGIDKVATHFINLKNSIDGVANTSKKLTGLQLLIQKINNFKVRNGFVTNVDLKTGQAHGKIAALKKDFQSLKVSIMEPVIPTGAITGFQILDGKMTITAMTAEGTTKTMEAGLSQVSLKALGVAAAADKVGDEILESGISGKVALDILQKEYDELIAKQLIAKAVGKATRADNLGNQADQIKKLMDSLSGGIGKTSQTLSSSLKKVFSKALSSLGKIAPTLLAIAAVIAEIAVIIWGLYESSPFKKAKDDVGNYSTSIDNLSRSIETCEQKTEALANILDIVTDEEAFEGLIEGSTKWYLKIEETNQKLLEQIDLLSQLGYEVKTSYGEDGILQIDNLEEIKAEQLRTEQRKTELQIAKLNSDDILKVLNKKVELEGSRLEYIGNSTIEAMDEAFYQIDEQLAPDLRKDGEKFDLDDFIVILNGLVAANDAVYAPVEDISAEGANELEMLSKQAVSSIISRTIEDPKELAAARKVLEVQSGVYDEFFANPEKTLPEGFTIADFANDELQYKGKDISTSNFEEVMKQLGYESNGEVDYDAIASQLGLNYKGTGGLEGFYLLSDDGSKEFLDFSNHGQIDTAEEWEELISSPSGKNIDLGYVSMLLAQNPAIQGAITDKYSYDEATIEKILYGTKDYKTQAEHEDYDVQEVIRIANEKKREIEDNIVKNFVGADGLALSSNTQGLQDFVNNLYKIQTDFNEQTALTYQTMVLSTYGSLEGEEQNLKEVSDRYQELFQDLDLSKPSEALEVLNQKIEQGVEGAEELKAGLTAEGGDLDLSSQFSELYTSGILEEISEDISEISDKAGNIDVTATRELVDSNTELKTIMDEFNLSGYAMGKILTDIQNGELTLTEINNGLAESYKTLYSAMGQAEDVLYDLRNADLGEDYTEIGRTFSERYDTVQDLYKRGAYGSENFAGNIKSLIGEEEWEKYLKESEGSNKTAYENIVKDYYLDENIGNLYGSFSSLIKENETEVFGIDKEGKITYDLTVEGIETYDDVLGHMVEAFGISREYAKAMLADMATYSDTLQNDLNTLNAVALAQKNYDSMFFDSTGVGYTAQTNMELASIYGQTDQWLAAEERVNTIEGWEELSEQEKNNRIVEQFKKDQEIVNTYKDQQIEKVDSQGNIYYKDEDKKVKIANKEVKDTRTKKSTSDEEEKKQREMVFEENGKEKTKTYQYDKDKSRWEQVGADAGKYEDEKTQAQLSADAVQEQMASTSAIDFSSLATEMEMEVEDVYSGLQEIASDPLVMQMAAELDTEEYDVWLSENYGENAPEILLSAGFSQESLANVETAKNEMITQIQAIAQALAALEVTIPITLGGANSGITFMGKEYKINLPGFKTELKIGGDGTTASPVELPGPSTTSDGGSTTFTSESGGTGTSYPYGDDEDNVPGDSGGGSETEEVEKRNYAAENQDKQLEALDRVRETNDREAELIDKLPEEIQLPLKMMNMAEDMAYEYQEIQINKNKLAALESEQELANAEAIANKILGEQGSGAPIYYDEMLESYMWDVEAAEKLSKEDREKAHETKDSLDELNSSIQEVKSELDGGKIQKIFHTAGKASTAFSKALKDAEKDTRTLGDEFAEFGKKYGLEKPFRAIGDKFEDLIDETNALDNEFEGLGIVSDDVIDKLAEWGASEDMQNLVKNTLGSGGGTFQSLLGDMTGVGGEMLTGIGDMLNFDMMSMGLDMFNQMKDMASQMIQYVVQFVQTIVNWWINREDWLYNLLSAIEQEVRNFNRQSEVEERFRLYSDEGLNDLVSAWHAMRESLEKQIDLNEQLIESRQAELQFLNLTNLPFSPAFYYDYEEERVIENPWVYDIYVLLLDLGAMIPEIGGIFSSIKQLMEDNKQRMEDAVEEIEDARDEILELEKQQLELRTKYMEDEIELEELVMDTIIEKQQEEIDELSAMNDAITEGNEKLIETLNSNLDRLREQRDNEEKEEELGEKERRLAYLRQDTSGANRAEIMDLQDELDDERRDYTDELIDQKISALEEQNELAAEQRQKQIDLLQAQLDHTEKYGLQWEEAQTLIKNGFDSEGRLRVGTDLYNMLMSKEEFTSMGMGSTRQTQQIMDWNVTSIAAAAFREINDIWDEGFGNFAMSNDVHDQSRLHLWEDRDVDYYQLPQWLSFLQPAMNTIQDYLWRTGNNVEIFVETGFLSGKNSSSILGKTVIPLVQNLFGMASDKVEGYYSLSESETGSAQRVTGAITEAKESSTLDWGERAVKSITDGFVETGENIVSGFKGLFQSNSTTTQNTTEKTGDVTINNNFNMSSDDGDFVDQIVDVFRTGNVGLKI